MKALLLASNNKHKIKEFKEILSNYKVVSMEEVGFTEDIIEDGNTFEENAIIKAKELMNYVKEKNLDYDVIADDSGLSCISLKGEPGVFSARYAGNHDDQKNRDKLRKELKGKDPSAYFTCCIAWMKQNGTYQVFEGKTYGKIIEEEKGKKDFGYDCIFLSDDLKKTFGEATEDEKNRVSHRKRAIEELKKELEK